MSRITMASLASDRAGTDDVDVITLVLARATREGRRMARGNLTRSLDARDAV